MLTVPNYTDLLGKPWRRDARGPDAYDCYGLGVELYRRVGLVLPEYSELVAPAEVDAQLSDGVLRHGMPVEVPEPLDLIRLQVLPKYITHCGFYVGHGRFMHISKHISVAIEELAHPLWADKVRGFYRFRGAL